jgi:hypothetical protein
MNTLSKKTLRSGRWTLGRNRPRVGRRASVGSGTGGDFVFLQDPIHGGATGSADDIAAGGQTKDTQNISNWQWKGGSAENKNDIEHAFGTAYKYTGQDLGNVKSGDQIVYLGLDRFDNSGDSSAGFWLFQNPISLNPDGTYSGEHTVGDVLLAFNAK